MFSQTILLCCLLAGFSTALKAQNAQFNGPTCIDPSTPEFYTVPIQSGASYFWTATNGTILHGLGTPSVQVKWNGAGSLKLNVHLGGSGDQKILPVTVSPVSGTISGTPPPGAASAIDCIEPGLTYTYTVNPTGGSNYTYAWSFDAVGIATFVGGNNTSQTVQVIWPSNIGNFPGIHVKIVSANGCLAYPSRQLNRKPDPTINGPVCIDVSANPTHQYTFNDMLGSATNTINFISGSGTISYPPGSSELFLATFTSLPATIRHTMTSNVGGCSEVSFITINDNSMVLNTSTIESCAPGCNGTAAVSVSGGGGPFNYSWSTLAGGTPGPFPSIASLTNMCPGAYQVEVNNAAGCPSFANVVVQGVSNSPSNFNPASTSDNNASMNPSFGVQNTGNDVHSCDGCPAGELQVMVWDGGNASMSWDNGNGIQETLLANPGAVDPDVVAGTLNGNLFAMVVYEFAGEVYFENYEYNPFGNTFSLLTGPTQLSFVSPPGAPASVASHPNIGYVESSLGMDGQLPAVAVTWQENGRIAGKAGFIAPASPITFPGLMPNNTFFTYSHPVANTAGHSKPDVAGFHQDGWDYMWNFTYLKDNSAGTHDLVVNQFTVNDLLGWSTPPSLTINTFEPRAGFTYDNPRIACEGNPGGGDYISFFEHWEIAVEYRENTPGGLQYIHGINGNRHYDGAGNYYLAEFDLTPCNLNNCRNYKPVVDYQYQSGRIVIAWEHNSNLCGLTPTQDEEIIAVTTDLDGFATLDEYSIVNSNVNDVMTRPSIAGRYASNSQQMLYTFFDDNNQQMFYKASANFPSVRLAVAADEIASIEDQNAEMSSISAYPNPTAGHLTLEGLEEGTVSISVFNLLGEEVLRINDQVANRYEININSLPQGVYSVRIEQADRHTSMLVVKE